MKIFELLEGLFGRRESGATELEPDGSDEPDVDPYNPFPDPVTIEIRDVIDLHTIPPREVKKVVEEYLSEARRKGFGTVRIIHGKGTGALRERVAEMLRKESRVTNFRLGAWNEGGAGVTVVELK